MTLQQYVDMCNKMLEDRDMSSNQTINEAITEYVQLDREQNNLGCSRADRQRNKQLTTQLSELGKIIGSHYSIPPEDVGLHAGSAFGHYCSPWMMKASLQAQ